MLVGLTAYVVVSYTGRGVIFLMFQGGIPAEQKIENLRAYFEAWGMLAPLAYISLVVLEVVIAPLPGPLIAAPAGTIFGGFLAGVYTLIGQGVGTWIAFFIMRIFGSEFLGRGFQKKIKRFEKIISDRGLLIIFLLRINPLTTSDFVSYAAGLTRLRAWKCVAGTVIGYAPLAFLQTYLGNDLIQRYPWVLYPIVIVCLLYAFGLVWLIRYMGRAGNDDQKDEIKT